MSTSGWVAIHTISAIFWLWVAVGGGAEKLEATFSSGCLVSIFAPSWSAEGLRLFAWLSLLLGAAWFLLGLIEPSFRAFG